MEIEHFGGKMRCNNLETLDNLLSTRYGKGVNEFWIYGENKFPHMGILVNGDFAYIHYFQAEDQPGFRSVGTVAKLNENVFSVFYTNTIDEEIQISTDAVVLFPIALAAAKEFFLNPFEMPKNLEWFEL